MLTQAQSILKITLMFGKALGILKLSKLFGLAKLYLACPELAGNDAYTTVSSIQVRNFY